MQFGWVQTQIQFSVVSGPKFIGLFSLNAGGIAGDHMPFRFWISWPVPEIFAIELWSCLKSRRILQVFGLQFLWGESPPEFSELHYKIIPASEHVAKFHGDRSRDFIGRWTREESLVITCLSDFGYLDPFRRYSRSKFELVWNRAEFCMFWPPISWGGGGPPEFLDLRYKEHPHCDHVAKFRGDRLTELGGSPANKKKTSAVKHKAFRTNVRAA